MELLQIQGNATSAPIKFSQKEVPPGKALEKGKTLIVKPDAHSEPKVGLFSSVCTMEVQKQENTLFNNNITPF